MVSSLLLFFARLNKYVRPGQGTNSQAGAGNGPVLPLHTENEANAGTLPDGYDPAEAGDLSYEDALIGLEIRSFMLAEYGSVEPPRGVFRRLMRAIEQRSTLEARPNNAYTWLAAIYRALSGPMTGRLVPGAVAFALLIMVWGSNGSQLLGSTGRTLTFQQSSLSSPTPESGVLGNVITGASGSEVRVDGLTLHIKDETQFYDPVERLVPPKRHDNSSAEADATQQDIMQYDRSTSAK